MTTAWLGSFHFAYLPATKHFRCRSPGDFLESAQHRLITDHFGRYPSSRKFARPVIDYREPVVVTFQAILFQILNVNEKEQVIQVEMENEHVSIAVTLNIFNIMIN